MTRLSRMSADTSLCRGNEFCVDYEYEGNNKLYFGTSFIVIKLILYLGLRWNSSTF